jgi:hypothetical protein
MPDRLKTISLRRFREKAAEIHEPVDIAIRDRQGNFQTIGYFTPYLQAPQILDLGEDVSPEAVEAVRAGIGAGTIKTPEEARAVAKTIAPVRAFPKSAQTGRKTARAATRGR